MQLATAADRSPFRVSNRPYDTHWQGYVLGEDTEHRFLWIWQGFNIRMIAVPHGDPTGYDYAWCYPRDPQAVEAAAAQWNPQTQDEPPGWHKRPTRPARRAPLRDQEPEYNRPRCEHGCYIAEGCRTIGCPDAQDGAR
jgi:hypothetical protein